VDIQEFSPVPALQSKRVDAHIATCPEDVVHQLLVVSWRIAGPRDLKPVHVGGDLLPLRLHSVTPPFEVINHHIIKSPARQGFGV